MFFYYKNFFDGGYGVSKMEIEAFIMHAFSVKGVQEGITLKCKVEQMQ